MRIKDTESMVIGQHFLTCIFNADFSGLEGDELKQAIKLVDEIGTRCVDLPDRETFFARCSVTGLYSDCVEVSLITFEADPVIRKPDTLSDLDELHAQLWSYLGVDAVYCDWTDTLLSYPLSENADFDDLLSKAKHFAIKWNELYSDYTTINEVTLEGDTIKVLVTEHYSDWSKIQN